MDPEVELTLDEMLADPIVHLVMRRDGVDETDIRALIQHVARGLQQVESRSVVDWPTGLADPAVEIAGWEMRARRRLRSRQQSRRVTCSHLSNLRR